MSYAFAHNPVSAVQAHYARASTGASLHDVFFRPDVITETAVAHEAFHTFLGADDAILEERHLDTASLSKAGCNYAGHAY